ncbi:hypothetical protein GTA08_BOTSDO08417 [Neofusicoccum parvum]|nr:hypothetical protein GTA08_BOTSDO08417 [Neofusicoccum parvum]
MATHPTFHRYPSRTASSGNAGIRTAVAALANTPSPRIAPSATWTTGRSRVPRSSGMGKSATQTSTATEMPDQARAMATMAAAGRQEEEGVGVQAARRGRQSVRR